jgi:hypothetical protein
VNAYVSFRITGGLNIALRSNNLLNTRGFTETQAAVVPSHGLATARSIVGRTIEATLRYTF